MDLSSRRCRRFLGTREVQCDGLRLPEPAADEPDLHEVFPSLSALCDDHFYATYSGWSGLYREDHRLHWPEMKLLRLLELDASSIFIDPKRLSLFVRAVGVARQGVSSAAVDARLTEICRQGMRSLKLIGVMRHKESIQRFLAVIPLENKLGIDMDSIPDEIAARLVEPLWEEANSVLLTPIGNGNGRPTREETEALLVRLLDLEPVGPAEDFFECRVSVACQIVGRAR